VRPSSPAGSSTSDSFAILPGQQPADFVPGISCSGSIGASDPVAVVQLHEAQPTGELVLRDYANPSSPRTACTLGNVPVVQIIDSRHVVIAHAAWAVVDLPEARFHWFQLPRVADSTTEFLAVSPRRDQVVWLKYRIDSTTSMATSREIHVTTAVGDRVIASLPDEPVGFCGAPPDYSKRAAHSASGAHLFLLDHPRTLQGLNSASSLRVFDGDTAVLSLVPPSGGWAAGEHPAMAVWSPTSETLYYRQGGDVWEWTPSGGSSVFLPGVKWFYPTITPDGRDLAYQDSDQFVYVMDLAAGGDPQRIGEAREKPVFLNNTQLWYTTPNIHGCATGDQEPVIYDIVDGAEFPSVIDWVLEVWPGTSAWY
jgi:hypothetical protein